jgi:uncharacterized protein YciI
MLLAVILNQDVALSELREQLKSRREVFLGRLKDSGELLLECSLGDAGSLMVLEADSVNSAIALLQNDPFVIQPLSNSVQVRPLTVNLLGDPRLLLQSWRREVFRLANGQPT